MMEVDPFVVADTIAFGNGGFDLGTYNQPGTNNLDVNERNGVFTLFNDDGSTIVGLGLQGSSNSDRLGVAFGPQNPANAKSLNSSNSDLVTKRFTANLDSGGDRLNIGGGARSSEVNMQNGSDRFSIDGQFRSSDFTGGKGNDRARFSGVTASTVARKSQIDMGEGDDFLVFGGNVNNISANMGIGADEVRFQGDIGKTKLNLGSDSDRDVIKLSDSTEFSGFRIKGADENDVLFIGSSEYQYDGGRTWTNIDNPDDTVRF